MKRSSRAVPQGPLSETLHNDGRSGYSIWYAEERYAQCSLSLDITTRAAGLAQPSLLPLLELRLMRCSRHQVDQVLHLEQRLRMHVTTLQPRKRIMSTT